MSRLVENDYEEEQEIDFEDRVVEDILEMLNRGDEEDDVAAIGMGRNDFGNEWREVDRRLQQGVQEQKEGDEEDGASRSSRGPRCLATRHRGSAGGGPEGRKTRTQFAEAN